MIAYRRDGSVEDAIDWDCDKVSRVGRCGRKGARA